MFSGFFDAELLVHTDSKHLILLGCVDEGTACGALAAASDKRTVTMLSVAVSPNYRLRGYGTALVNTLCQLFSGGEFSSVEAYVSSSDGYNESAVSFLQHCFFLETDRAQSYTVLLKDIAKSPILLRSEDYGIKGTVLPMSKVPHSAFRSFNHELVEKEIYPDIAPDSFTPELSFCIYENQMIASCLLLSAEIDGSYTLSWLYTTNGKHILPLINAALQNLLDFSKDDAYVHIATVNEISGKLFEKIRNDCQVKSIETVTFERWLFV
jgi:GNAT superfamily N-acetyltransferase